MTRLTLRNVNSQRHIGCGPQSDVRIDVHGVPGSDVPEDAPPVGRYAGTGLHGGEIFIRGGVQDYQLGKEVSRQDLTREDERTLRGVVKDYCGAFRLSFQEVMARPFVKLAAVSHRPCGRLYAY